jgi:predicted dehydrogenase
VATLVFENGALGVVDAFFCIPDDASRNALELYGSLGSILATGTIGQEAAGQMVAHLSSAGPAYDARQQRTANGALPIEPPVGNTYRAEIEEFGQAILEGRDPVNNAQIGLRSQELLAACYESARLRRQVEM